MARFGRVLPPFILLLVFVLETGEAYRLLKGRDWTQRLCRPPRLPEEFWRTHRRGGYQGETGIWRPRNVTTNCEVHDSCQSLEGSSRRADGHMQPIGRQALRSTEIPVVDVDDITVDDFVANYMEKGLPLIIKRGAMEHPAVRLWSDEYLAKNCNHADGHPWYATVEMNKRIKTNSRGPFKDDWDFCAFIANYRAAETQSKYYVVSGLSNYLLREDLKVPWFLQCRDFRGMKMGESIYDAHLWMSSGNTSSSLHFDTGDNMALQIDGEKEVILWDPEYSRELYTDFHDKFGLSPINVEHVDLDRFPLFKQAPQQTGTVQKGDLLYIPSHWWHHIRSHRRNIMVALHFSPYGSVFFKYVMNFWPDRLKMRRSQWAEGAIVEAKIQQTSRVLMGHNCTNHVQDDRTFAHLEMMGDNPLLNPYGVDELLRDENGVETLVGFDPQNPRYVYESDNFSNDTPLNCTAEEELNMSALGYREPRLPAGDRDEYGLVSEAERATTYMDTQYEPDVFGRSEAEILQDRHEQTDEDDNDSRAGPQFDDVDGGSFDEIDRDFYEEDLD